ncbi:MAG: hypothetical protein AABX10_02270 [Nanoarchaeota archaeon]
MFLQQPDVAITDFLLMLEAITLACLILQIKGKNKIRSSTFLFYISLALGSFIGGIVHGFFPESGSLVNFVLWKATMISLGLVTLFSWIIAGTILLPKRNKLIIFLASLEFVFYAVYTLFINSDFKIAIYNYIPAILLLLISFFYTCFKLKNYNSIFGIIGVVLTFIAAWIQQAQVSIHPIYFNYNALYHVIQAIAILLIFVSLRYIISTKEGKNEFKKN